MRTKQEIDQFLEISLADERAKLKEVRRKAVVPQVISGMISGVGLVMFFSIFVGMFTMMFSDSHGFDLPIKIAIISIFGLVGIILIGTMISKGIKPILLEHFPGMTKGRPWILLLSVLIICFGLGVWQVASFFFVEKKVGIEFFLQFVKVLVLTVGTFLVAKLIGIPGKRFKGKYRTLILPKVVKFLFPDATYAWDKALPRSLFEDSKLFTHGEITRYKGNMLVAEPSTEVSRFTSFLHVRQKVVRRKAGGGTEVQIKDAFVGQFFAIKLFDKAKPMYFSSRFDGLSKMLNKMEVWGQAFKGWYEVAGYEEMPYKYFVSDVQSNAPLPREWKELLDAAYAWVPSMLVSSTETHLYCAVPEGGFFSGGSWTGSLIEPDELEKFCAFWAKLVQLSTAPKSASFS